MISQAVYVHSKEEWFTAHFCAKYDGITGKSRAYYLLLFENLIAETKTKAYNRKQMKSTKKEVDDQ